MAYITLEELKAQLNIENGFIDDDLILRELLEVVTLSINNYCCGGLDEYDDNTIPVTVKHACKLLGQHFYINRNMVSFSAGVEIPYTFKYLLEDYRNKMII